MRTLFLHYIILLYLFIDVIMLLHKFSHLAVVSTNLLMLQTYHFETFHFLNMPLHFPHYQNHAIPAHLHHAQANLL